MVKDYWGIGFRSFGQFNVGLLVKQGRCILKNLNSLLVKVLKAKYFPPEQFF